MVDKSAGVSRRKVLGAMVAGAAYGLPSLVSAQTGL